jgi:hypothetical protein
MWKCIPRVYISSSGIGVSGSNRMPVDVHLPPGSVERTAQVTDARVAPASTVIG